MFTGVVFHAKSGNTTVSAAFAEYDLTKLNQETLGTLVHHVEGTGKSTSESGVDIVTTTGQTVEARVEYEGADIAGQTLSMLFIIILATVGFHTESANITASEIFEEYFLVKTKGLLQDLVHQIGAAISSYEVIVAVTS